MKTYNEIKLAQELIRFPTIKTEDRGIMVSTEVCGTLSLSSTLSPGTKK